MKATISNKNFVILVKIVTTKTINVICENLKYNSKNLSLSICESFLDHYNDFK